MEGNGQIRQPQNVQQIASQSFSAKFSSKAEVYRFMAIDVKAYLPPYECVTMWHLRDLAANKKRVSWSRS